VSLMFNRLAMLSQTHNRRSYDVKKTLLLLLLEST